MGLHCKPTVIIVDSYTAEAIASSEGCVVGFQMHKRRWKLIQYFRVRELRRILIDEFVSLAIIHCKLHSAVFISFFIGGWGGCAVVFLDLDVEEVDYIPKP